MEEINLDNVRAESNRIMNLDIGTGTSYSRGGNKSEKDLPTALAKWESKKTRRKAIAELRKEYELKRFRNLSLQFK